MKLQARIYSVGSQPEGLYVMLGAERVFASWVLPTCSVWIHCRDMMENSQLLTWFQTHHNEHQNAIGSANNDASLSPIPYTSSHTRLYRSARALPALAKLLARAGSLRECG